jgi:hypothetical protein
MVGMSFNEFQRELAKHGIEGKLAIVLTEIYGVVREQGEQLDQLAGTCTALANSIQGFVGLHETTQGHITALKKRISGETEGVSLSSVPLRDDN